MKSDLQEAKAHRYASVADGAKYAAVSGRTIRRCIAAGRIKGYRLGPRVLRVDLDELDALLRGGDFPNA